MLVIRIGAVILALVPLLYLGDGRSRWPLYLGWIVGGAVWAGINLASFNLVTETSTPRRRVRCYAYMQATIGITVAFYMFFWGALADHLPILFHHQLQTVFFCSAILRMLPALGLIFLVRERVLRPSASVRALLAELPAVRPTMEIMRELMKPLSKSQG
jgi:MFS family permease